MSVLLLNHDVNAKDSAGITPLWIAIESKSSKEIVELLLKNGADINEYSFEWKLFNCAVQMGSIETVKLFLQYGAKVNEQNCVTPLFYAVCTKDNTEVVQLLLELSDNVNISDLDGRTPLHYAVRTENNEEIIKLLLGKGADIVFKSKNGFTALRNCDLDYVTNVKILLENGADPNVPKDDNLLHIYSASNSPKHIEGIHLLLKHGANPNSRHHTGKNTLHIAVMFKNEEAVKLLLKYGAEVNAKYKYGQSPLHMAVRTEINNEVVIKLLLTHGADMNARNDLNYTPLLEAFSDSRFEFNSENIKLLLKNGADPNVCQFVTPLFYAVQNKNYADIVQLLLELGANVNARDTRDNTTPLHWAIDTEENEKIIKLLFEKGADIEARDKNGYTAVSKCNSDYKGCAFGNLKILLENGADPNFPEGNTLLHSYSKSNTPEHLDCLRLLLEHNTKPNFQDSHEKTPLHVVIEFENEEAVILLLKYSAEVNVKDD